MLHEDYEFLDEEKQNAYTLNVMKAVLIDRISNNYNAETIARVAALLFSWEPQVVRWLDDGGLGIAYPKDHDRVQKHLASMAIQNLRN